MLGESCVDVGDNGSLPQFSSFVPESVSSF